MRKKILLAGFLLLALILAVPVWTAVSSTGNLSISSGSSLGSGEVADVSDMGGSFTITQGAAQVTNGVELFQINLGSASFSDQIRVDVLLLNSEEMSGVLNNPNAWIEVALWYEDAGGSHTLSDGTTIVSKDNDSSRNITKAFSTVVLTSSTPNLTKLYVLASIHTPGGIPPGQQDQLFSLEFYQKVRL